MPSGIYKHKSPTAATLKRLSISHRGKKHSKETKQKISNTKKGCKGTSTSWKKGDHIGNKHPQWKGGISRTYKTGYYSEEYKLWRKTVFERDGYTCQICRKVGCYLTAHHIKSFAHNPKLRFNINNGITLCEDCHSMTDNYKGRGRKKLCAL